MRGRQIYDITYMWNLLKNDTEELIYKKETNPDFKPNLMVTIGETVAGELEDGNNIYTL